MTKTKYIVKTTTQFKKDYKLAVKRGLKIGLLKDIVAALAMGKTLPPDWLLIYRIEDDVLVLTLTRTGSHSDLFGK